MKNKEKILGISLILSLLIIFFILFLPYIAFDYNLLIGSDAGSYVHELDNYLSGGEYKNIISLWHEPMMYVLLQQLFLFTGLSEFSLYLCLQALCVILSSLFLYLLLKNLKKRNYSALATILVFTSSITLAAFFHAFYRQLIAIPFFILTIYIMSLRNKKYNYILIPIVAFILMTHRGIGLLTIIIMIVNLFLINKFKKEDIKNNLLIIGLALLFSTPFYFLNLKMNWIIFKDFINNSLSNFFGYDRENAGRSVVEGIKNINPLIDYIKKYFILFLVGISGIIKNGRGNILLIMTSLVLIIWTVGSFVFSNRLIIILNILIIIYAIIAIDNISKKKIKIILLAALIISSILLSINYSIDKRPYMDKNTPGTEYLLENIPRENTFIIAPRSLQVSLSQWGYKVPMTDDKINYEGKIWMERTDNFFINGPNTIESLLEDISENSETYVLFTQWYTKNPMGDDLNSNIKLEEWDSSKKLNIEYSSENGIVRIYKIIKKEGEF